MSTAWQKRQEAIPTPAADDRRSIIFSVDVEDWAQSTLDDRLPISDYCADNVLRLLDEMGHDPAARGTFFVLGKFAKRHPITVRRIWQAGHEVACHGFGHVPLHRLNPRSFRDDVRRCVGLLTDIVGLPIRGYRAPVFSVSLRTLWALETLHGEGFVYDSSIFPIKGPRYGIPDWPTESCHVRLPGGGSIIEFPLTATRLIGRRWPVSGGGYARVLPRHLLRLLFTRETRRRRDWPVFYCHPHEIDPAEFRRATPTPPWGSVRLSWTLRLHQQVGRQGFLEKIRALQQRFRFRAFDEALDGVVDSLDLPNAVNRLNVACGPVPAGARFEPCHNALAGARKPATN